MPSGMAPDGGRRHRRHQLARKSSSSWRGPPRPPDTGFRLQDTFASELSGTRGGPFGVPFCSRDASWGLSLPPAGCYTVPIKPSHAPKPPPSSLCSQARRLNPPGEAAPA